VGHRWRIALHGLDTGIPAGMTTRWVLPGVLIGIPPIPALPSLSD
jgi:hypothetical protein